ncbi:hypothetical protein B7463_g12061, partial [Scytalidium lignicola]
MANLVKDIGIEESARLQQKGDHDNAAGILYQAIVDQIHGIVSRVLAHRAEKERNGCGSIETGREKVLGTGAGGWSGVMENGTVLKRDSGNRRVGNFMDRCDAEPGGMWQRGDAEVWITWNGWFFFVSFLTSMCSKYKPLEDSLSTAVILGTVIPCIGGAVINWWNCFRPVRRLGGIPREICNYPIQATSAKATIWELFHGGFSVEVPANDNAGTEKLVVPALYTRGFSFLSLLKNAAFTALVLLTDSTAAIPLTPRTKPDVHLSLQPNTVVLDGSRLFTTKLILKLGPLAPNVLPHRPLQPPKKILPPGGDIHDYASQAPYWWPNPNTADGCPYIQKDGVRNPAVDNYTDHGDRGNMFQASYILALAWYYTGEAKYSRHAGDILRTWFLNPATKMNPNLNHAQIIPCQNDGRSIGIIDFSQQYTSTVDAALILSSPSTLLSGIFSSSSSSAPGWSSNDQTAFLAWNKEFLDWLVNSDFGKEEYEADNNHGTFAAMQNAALALYVGNTALASQIARNATRRINSFITANGSQPLELVRTRSFHYSTFD